MSKNNYTIDLGELDVTLKHGNVLSNHLGSWLIEAALNPANVKLKVIESEDEYQIVELQDSKGTAVGGIIYRDFEGTVYVTAAIDPKREPYTKRRSLPEMKDAQIIALRNQSYMNKALRFYNNRFYACLLLILMGIGIVRIVLWLI